MTVNEELRELVEAWHNGAIRHQHMDVVQARNALWRRCKDAGWSDNRAAKYLDRVLPWPAETAVTG